MRNPSFLYQPPRGILKALIGVEFPTRSAPEKLVDFLMNEWSSFTVTFDDVDPTGGIKHKKTLYLTKHVEVYIHNPR